MGAFHQPAWSREPGPDRDVVLATRVRYMRNLQGYAFPAALDGPKAVEVERQIRNAARDLNTFGSMTSDERERLLGARLVSADFHWTQPGRALLFDSDFSTTLMINEEDHIRLQVLGAGWCFGATAARADAHIKRLGADLRYAHTPEWGYLASSVFNAGEGRRYSAMLHLAGLAQTRRMALVAPALEGGGLIVRGLFGESSKAIGAFIQISSITGPVGGFTGGIAYLLQQERIARQELGVGATTIRARKAKEALLQRDLSLTESLRELSWLRLAIAQSERIGDLLQIDRALTIMESREHAPEEALRDRTEELRQIISTVEL